MVYFLGLPRFATIVSGADVTSKQTKPTRVRLNYIARACMDTQKIVVNENPGSGKAVHRGYEITNEHPRKSDRIFDTRCCVDRWGFTLPGLFRTRGIT